LRGDGGDGQKRKAARDHAFILEKGMKGSGRKKGKQAGEARERHFGSDFQRLPRAAGKSAGPEGEGFTGSLKILDGEDLIAALALGMAQGALERPQSTRSSENSLGRRSASFRRYSSSWRTWPLKWRRRGCSFIRRRGGG